MIRFRAHRYDGATSRREAVTVEVYGDGTVEIEAPRGRSRMRLEELEVGDRLGDTPRFVRLPDGSRLETADHDAVDRALAALGPGRRPGTWLHRLESGWRWAIAALAATVIAAWLAVDVGIPYAAERVARHIPPALEQGMAADALAALDAHLTAPSRLDRAGRERVLRVAGRLRALAPEGLAPRVELRAAPQVGPNAFALPGAVIVVTDDLVRLVPDDAELLAVLAHELGHVRNRHVLRSLLQSSATAVLVAVAIGDLTSVTGLAATLPTFLLQAKYSREFEREADRFAAGLLVRAGLGVEPLVSALERLGASSPAGAGRSGEEPPLARYASTHPPTAERIAALRALDAGR